MGGNRVGNAVLGALIPHHMRSNYASARCGAKCTMQGITVAGKTCYREGQGVCMARTRREGELVLVFRHKVHHAGNNM